MNIADTFIERKGEWVTALFQHLQISLLSLLIAIIIAVPLGIILSNNKKISEWFLQITGVFQTIPSLALLGLLIAVFIFVRYGLFIVYWFTTPNALERTEAEKQLIEHLKGVFKTNEITISPEYDLEKDTIYTVYYR